MMYRSEYRCKRPIYEIMSYFSEMTLSCNRIGSIFCHCIMFLNAVELH